MAKKDPNRLRVLRAEQRKTQTVTAYKAGMTQTKLSLIENGYIIPTPKERARLARALGVPESVAFPSEEVVS